MATQHVAPDSPPFTRCPGNQKLTRTNYCSQIHNFLTFTKCFETLNKLNEKFELPFTNTTIGNDYCILMAWSDLSIGSVSPQSVGPPLNSALASHHSHFCVRFALIHTFCSSSPDNGMQLRLLSMQSGGAAALGCREVQMCLRLSVTSNCSFSHITGIFSIL